MMITKQDIQTLFEETRRDGQWNLKEPMLYGYFFTDIKPDNLIIAKDMLINQGYNFVDLFLADKENTNEEDLYFLHVEKIEIHTVNSLHERNQLLYKLALDLTLDSYDGFDYGPPI